MDVDQMLVTDACETSKKVSNNRIGDFLSHLLDLSLSLSANNVWLIEIQKESLCN